MKTNHQSFKVEKTGFFIDTEHPFIGASPDGLVDCKCHGAGLLEIKCPWTYRQMSIQEYAAQKLSCLQIGDNDVVSLKTTHEYFYQIQCQMHVTKAL